MDPGRVLDGVRDWVDGTDENVVGCGRDGVGALEACDDNNLLSRDGCSNLCQVESGYVCTTVANGTVPVSVCREVAANQTIISGQVGF